MASVAGYMIDSGNETTFGHRRIILSNRLGPIGLGSTGQGGASCMQNIGGTGNAGKTWVAWPPPGPFPMQAYGSGTPHAVRDRLVGADPAEHHAHRRQRHRDVRGRGPPR